MNKFHSVVDSEIRVVHPEAREVNYAKNFKEPVHTDIYSDPRIIKSRKLWNINSVIESMDKCNINVPFSDFHHCIFIQINNSVKIMDIR